MADLTWIDALQFGSASGVVAGLANQGFGYLRDLAGYRNTAKAQATERAHQAGLQAKMADSDAASRREERAHQAALRSEAAHADARSVYLPLAQEVRDWIDFSWGNDFGSEVGYHGTHAPKPAIAEAGVIARLANISTGHPSSDVRGRAKSLKDTIDGVVNMVEGFESYNPGVEDYSRWLTASDEMIEAIHLPSSRSLIDEA